MPSYDLHCHSTWSDGLLGPGEVVSRAAARGVDVLALTDHDQLGGLDEARDVAATLGVSLVPGVEVSTSFEGDTVHVVGLGVDAATPALREGLARIRSGRTRRARRIADSLAEAGIRGAYEGARRYASHDELVARTHFARYLVEAGYANDVKSVFKRYLTPGHPGYVPHDWVPLAEAVRWIHAAGGQAVLAHPGRYKVGQAGLRRLLQSFKEAGGEAIEVLSSSHTSAQATEFATLARVYGFLGSCGSDYHGPGESALDLGELPALPTGVEPVWRCW